MNIPLLTQQEHAVLKKLAEDGPSRGILPPTSGRLGLYNLINETPAGWVITPTGKEALGRPVNAPSDAPRRPKRESGGRWGPRKPRIIPF
jgi:hypothetical protein